MSAIRTWLRAQREANNREAFAQLVAEHPPIPEPAFDTMDGLPYELSPHHPLAGAGPIPIPYITVEDVMASAYEEFRRCLADAETDMIALSGLPGGGRWLPPRS